MESIIQTIKQRLDQAEQELAYLKGTALERSQCHATHRAFWSIQDAYKGLTHLTKEIARTHQKNTNLELDDILREVLEAGTEAPGVAELIKIQENTN